MLRNCECFNPGLGIFPVLFSTLTGLTFIITYIISVSDDDVYPYFPTISDTGGRKPESNVFGLFLSISSFLGFVVVLIRMVQYRHICENNQEDHSKLLLINKVGCVVGAMACFGATLVANYQDIGSSATGHVVGALGVFGGGAIYCWFQSYLSARMLQCGMNTRRLCLLRIILTVMATVFFVAFLILFYFSTIKWKDGHNSNHNYATWGPGDGGYALHVIASVCEWLCAVSLLLFFISFTREFNKVKIRITVEHHDVNFVPFQTSTEEERQPVYA